MNTSEKNTRNFKKKKLIKFLKVLNILKILKTFVLIDMPFIIRLLLRKFWIFLKLKLEKKYGSSFWIFYSLLLIMNLLVKFL